MQALGQSLGEAVGKGFQQDVRIIIVSGPEAFEVWFDAVDTYREAAEPIVPRVDEVGAAEIGAVTRFLELLAQEGKSDLKRMSVVWGKGVSVRVDPGGRVIITK